MEYLLRSKDTEYVFPGRPSQQKHHSQMSLNEWYSGFLTAATETGIIEGFSVSRPTRSCLHQILLINRNFS